MVRNGNLLSDDDDGDGDDDADDDEDEDDEEDSNNHDNIDKVLFRCNSTLLQCKTLSLTNWLREAI